jgi:hypothetical protein
VIPSATFTWTSDNEGVATIDVNGLARGNSPGTARIRAEASGLQSPPVTLTVAPPYAVVQQIWNQFCIVCHPGQNPMNLRTGVSYSELVNHAAVGRQLLRVAPGDTTNSYLWIKVTQNCPNANCDGFRMPEFGPRLSDSQLRTIRDWIMAGAPP